MSKFSNLSWYTKKRPTYASSKSDVTIKVMSYKRKRDKFPIKGVQITFRHDSSVLIGDRIGFAVLDNCLIFNSDPSGYKTYACSSNHTSRYVKLTICDEFTEMLADMFCGDYDLKHDKESGLYYIEKE